MRGDENDSDERPKLSWREIDQRRDRSRHVSSQDRKPRGRAAEARAKSAAQRYVKELDGTLFAKAKGRPGSTEGRLAQGVRDALGTPDLAAACRAHIDEVGVPQDPALLSAFLDARERGISLAVLQELARQAREGALRVTSGLRSQLRALAEDADEELAELAEEILDKL